MIQSACMLQLCQGIFDHLYFFHLLKVLPFPRDIAIIPLKYVRAEILLILGLKSNLRLL